MATPQRSFAVLIKRPLKSGPRHDETQNRAAQGWPARTSFWRKITSRLRNSRPYITRRTCPNARELYLRAAAPLKENAARKLHTDIEKGGAPFEPPMSLTSPRQPIGKVSSKVVVEAQSSAPRGQLADWQRLDCCKRRL